MKIIQVLFLVFFCSFIFSAQSTQSSSPIVVNLLFNSNSSILDYSPLAVNPVQHGFSAGGHSYSFDGKTNYVDLGNYQIFPYSNSPRTICTLAKTNTISNGYRWIFSYGSPVVSRAFFIGMSGSTLQGGGYGEDDIRYPNFWKVGSWNHVCLAYDGNVAKLYGNGVFLTSANKSWNTSSGVISVGRQVNGFEFWNGSIASVQLYKRALTSSEISQLYEKYSSITRTNSLSSEAWYVCDINKLCSSLPENHRGQLVSNYSQSSNQNPTSIQNISDIKIGSYQVGQPVVFFGFTISFEILMVVFVVVGVLFAILFIFFLLLKRANH